MYTCRRSQTAQTGLLRSAQVHKYKQQIHPSRVRNATLRVAMGGVLRTDQKSPIRMAKETYQKAKETYNKAKETYYKAKETYYKAKGTYRRYKTFL